MKGGGGDFLQKVPSSPPQFSLERGRIPLPRVHEHGMGSGKILDGKDLKVEHAGESGFPEGVHHIIHEFRRHEPE